MRRHGFTLIEILMVVIILGIASALIVPQMGTRDDLKAAAGARVLMADLIYAQNRAITLQTMHYVQFGANQYAIYARDPADGVIKAVAHPINKHNRYVTRFDAESLKGVALGTVSFDGQTKKTLAFDELGTPYSCDSPGVNAAALTSGSVAVSSGAFTLTVRIEPYTGELTIQ